MASQHFLGTASGAPTFVTLCKTASRNTIASALIMLCSLGWLGTLIATDRAITSLPWCVTLFLVSALAVLQIRIPRLSEKPEGLHKPTFDFPKLDLMEACACSYILLSILIGAWLLYHCLHKSKPLLIRRQVVDIQLTSLSDFSDRHELLPSSNDLPSIRRQTSADKITQQGTLSVKSSSPIPVCNAGTQGKKTEALDKATATRLPHTRSLSALSSAEPGFVISQPRTVKFPNAESRSIEVSSMIPVSAKTRFVISQPQSDFAPRSELNEVPQTNRSTGKSYQSYALQQKHNEIFLEEVAPPDMVELLDNQGDTSLEVWQPGGHSRDGAGSRSLLVEYLKDLHKRLKKAWSPRAGETHSAEILFRIRRDGKLSSLKLMRSSGNPASDEAVMHAITSCSPLKPLPSDYALEYIDLQYTFNYTVDKLTEVNDTRIR